MELHQLEAFSAVMSVGSITGAGRLLDRSQPAVTRQIQELEADLGYALFHRSGPRVTPTNEAFLLYEEVERSLVGMRTIAQRARAIGNGEARPVVVAATAALATSVLPDALHRITSNAGTGDGVFPSLQLRTQSAEHVVHEVLTDHADIGLTTLPVAHEGLQVHWIASAPCVLALHPSHPLAARASDSDPETGADMNANAPRAVIPLAALKGVGIATVANRHRLRNRIDAAFAHARVRADIRLETNHAANALAAARAGSLAAIVDPASAAGHDGMGVSIHAIDADIPFLFALITRAGRPLPGPVQRLLPAIRESAAALLADRHGGHEVRGVRGVRFYAADQHDALLQQASQPRTRMHSNTRSSTTTHTRTSSGRRGSAAAGIEESS